MSRFPLPSLAPIGRRTMVATRLNAVANDPAVRPWLGGDVPIDLTAILGNPLNVAYELDGGGFVAIAQGEGHYEVHSLFLPTARRETVRLMRASLDHFFAATDAIDLLTKVPEGNAGAAALAQLSGFTPLGDVSMPWTDGQRTRLAVQHLSLDRWALRSACARQHGAWLHEVMATAQREAGSAYGPHEDDATHNALAGAAVLMVRAGNPVKAVTFYNRWAAITHFPPVRLVQLHPVILDLSGLIIEHRGDAMEILLCQ